MMMTPGAKSTKAVRGAAVWAAGVAVAVVGVLAVAPGAQAAEAGSGLGDFHLGSGYYKGSFVQDGQMLVCGEKGTSVPSAPLVASGMQDAAWINSHYTSGWGDEPQLTDDKVAGLNRLYTERLGESAVTDAAIEYATHAVMYPGQWRDLNGDPHASLNEMVATDLALPEVNAAGDIAAVQAYVTEFVDIINTTTAAVPVDGSGVLTFTDGADQFTKTVTVDATAGAVGTVTLTNAVFADTGEATKAVTAGEVLTVRVSAAADKSATVEVSGTAEMTVGTAGYAAQLATWQPENGVNQQASLGMGPAVAVTAFQIAGDIDAEITVAPKPIALLQTGE